MEMSMVDVRANFAEVVNRVAYGGERVVMKRRSKGVAAVVSMEDLNGWRKLEGRADVKAALKARKEKGGVTLAAPEEARAVGAHAVRNHHQAGGGKGPGQHSPRRPSVHRRCLGGASGEPRPRGAVKLAGGEENLWRVAVRQLSRGVRNPRRPFDRLGVADRTPQRRLPTIRQAGSRQVRNLCK